MKKSIAAEFLGTCFLVATVVGSGIMAEQLAGNAAVALLANAIATGAILVVLINIFGPLSGAHFNPLVTIILAIDGRHKVSLVAPYVTCQFAGAIVGVVLAHGMFELSLAQVSDKIRWGTGQWLAEAIAVFGLITVIFGSSRFSPSRTAMHVGLYIVAAYWFTASTSFANPAVTVARALTNTFSGISPISVGPFIIAQCCGGALALCINRWLFTGDEK